MINLLKLYDKTPDQVATIITQSEWFFDGSFNHNLPVVRELLDAITARYSAFPTFVKLLNAAGNYRPTIRCTKSVNACACRRELQELKVLADSYDYFQSVRGDSRRAFRG